MIDRQTPRIAAVLILVYPRNGQPHVVFTERTQTLRNHAGQVSLPGGSRDATDPSLEFTALRETEEELGVPARDVRVLGALGEVDTLGGSYRITPYAGFLEYEPEFRVQPDEVATVIEVPLAHLQDPQCFGDEEREAAGTVRRIRYCELGSYRITGPTALAVEEFLATNYPEVVTRALDRSVSVDLQRGE
jgi:8-oxo-dGTP pyrophosphatase MutT (NUDIX family)